MQKQKKNKTDIRKSMMLILTCTVLLVTSTFSGCIEKSGTTIEEEDLGPGLTRLPDGRLAIDPDMFGENLVYDGETLSSIDTIGGGDGYRSESSIEYVVEGMTHNSINIGDNIALNSNNFSTDTQDKFISFDSVGVSLHNISMIENVYYAPAWADSGDGTYYPVHNYWTNCTYNILQNMSVYGEGAIYYPKGRYMEYNPIIVDGLSSNMSSPRHFSMIGDGFWDTTIILSDNFDDTFLKIQENSASCYIQGITINGNRDGQSTSNPLILLNNSYDVTIKDTFITSSSGDGIKLVNSSFTAKILNSPIEYCDGHAINCTSGNNIVVKYCTLAHNIGAAINIIKGRPFVSDNWIRLDDGPGIIFGEGPGVSGGTFIGNTFFDSDDSYAIFNFSTNNSVNPNTVFIQGNTIDGGNYAFYNHNGRPGMMTITDNVIKNVNNYINKPFSARPDVIIKDNIGLNPIGYHQNAFHGDNYISLESDWQSNPNANQNYTVLISDVIITSTGGTGVNISLRCPDNTIIANYGESVDALLVPYGFKINFGAFSDAPTAKVYFT